jgi:tRNA pseudouridine65 synthase
MNDLAFEILFLDEDMVAVNKPTGIKVHRARGDHGEPGYVLQRLRDQIGRRLYPVHRLDRPTSGVLVFGLRPDVTRILAGYFTGRVVEKTYLAVVRGYVEEQGCIDRPLNRVDAAGRKCPEQVPALTRFHRLAMAELPVAVSRHPTSRYSLVEVRPETGRMHQIRRHFRHISHPVIGDRRHGDNRHNRYFTETLGVGRMLLASVELRLPHPATGEKLHLVGTLDAAFRKALAHLGWVGAVPPHWLGSAEGS